MYHNILYLRQHSIKEIETKNITRTTNAAIVIQSNVRRLLCQSRYSRALASIQQIQYCARKYIRAVQIAKNLLRDNRAAILIQKSWKMSEACKLLHSAVTISLWCQRHQRGNFCRMRINALKISRNLKSDEASTITLHSDDETVDIPRSQAGEVTSSEAFASSFLMHNSKITDEMKSAKTLNDFSVTGDASTIAVVLAESTMKLKVLQIENDSLKKQINMLTMSETTQALASRDSMEQIRNIHNDEMRRLIQERESLKGQINQLQNDIDRIINERDTMHTKYLSEETKVVSLSEELHTMKQEHQAKIKVSEGTERNHTAKRRKNSSRRRDTSGFCFHLQSRLNLYSCKKKQLNRVSQSN